MNLHNKEITKQLHTFEFQLDTKTGKVWTKVYGRHEVKLFYPLSSSSIGCVQKPHWHKIPSVALPPHAAARPTLTLWLWCSHDSVPTIPKSSLGLVLFLETRVGCFLEDEGGKQECRKFNSRTCIVYSRHYGLGQPAPTHFWILW